MGKFSMCSRFRLIKSLHCKIIAVCTLCSIAVTAILVFSEISLLLRQTAINRKYKTGTPTNLVKWHTTKRSDTSNHVDGKITLKDVDITRKHVTDTVALNKEIAVYLNASGSVYIARYVMENPLLCASVTNLSVLVIVHSAPAHCEIRNAIRKTWTNNGYLDPKLGTVKVLFLLGQIHNTKIQADLEHEFAEFKDILQGDFEDDYHNLSVKGVMGFKWITERCLNAKVVIKVDDDVVVNMGEVLADLRTYMKPKTVMCRISTRAPIFRKKTEKWYVPEHLFPNQQYFPSYCTGVYVSFSIDLIPKLLQSAYVTPHFWIDDVYLYGLLLYNVPNVTVTRIKETQFQHLSDIRKRSVCRRLVVLLEERDPKLMIDVWHSLRNHPMCSSLM